MGGVAGLNPVAVLSIIKARGLDEHTVFDLVMSAEAEIVAQLNKKSENRGS